jgi:formyltetrahydrofolate-dependent phosphoribosylglycinamide formyltransferase
MLRIGVLLSGRGRGSNLQAIMDACASEYIPGEVALVLSTTAEAPALERARAAGVVGKYVDPGKAQDADALDRELGLRLTEANVGLVALTGYLRLLGPEMLRRFPMRIMNTHPALLPAFGGRGFYGRHVHEAVLESGAKFSGATIQFADDQYDHGPIILQAVVPVLDDDTPMTLATRVLEQEHRLYPEAIRLFAQDRLRIEGRRVRILPEGEGAGERSKGQRD